MRLFYIDIRAKTIKINIFYPFSTYDTKYSVIVWWINAANAAPRDPLLHAHISEARRRASTSAWALDRFATCVGARTASSQPQPVVRRSALWACMCTLILHRLSKISARYLCSLSSFALVDRTTPKRHQLSRAATVPRSRGK